MSYDPSPGMPPRQERWPQATPAEGWPPHRDSEGEQAARQGIRGQRAAGSHHRQSGPRSAVATAAFPAVGSAYGATDGYGTDSYRTDGYTADSYRTDGYTADTDARGGHRQATGEYPADAGGGYEWARVGYAGVADGYAAAENGYAESGNGYTEARNGYSGPQSGYGQAGNGYTEARNGYSGAQSGYGQAGNGYGLAADGYPGAADGFDRAPDGYPGGAYLGPGSYTETAYPGPGYSDSGYSGPGYSGPGYSDPGYSDPGYSEAGYFGSEYSDPMLNAPDAGVHPDGWQEEQALRRAANHRGLMVSAATEFLATAVVIGVSTLAAGLLRSPVSPVGAMGTVFIDRTPAMLRGFTAHHFGTHGQAVLLLGMYAVIAVIAITIGVAARHAAALRVTGVAAFALIAAFVAVTRPASHVADVMPAVIGGLAGVAALLWLVRASAPTQGLQEVAPLRPARGGTRRRTR